MSMSKTHGKISHLAGVESLHWRLEGREDTHRLDHVTLLRPERRHLIVQLQYAVDDLNQVHGSLVLVVPRVLGDEFNDVVNAQNTSQFLFYSAIIQCNKLALPFHYDETRTFSITL